MSLTKVTYSMTTGAPVNVIDYISGGSGTNADPYVGWDTAITWSANTPYYFPSGVFQHSSTLELGGLSGISLKGTGVSTVLKFTGTGPCVSFDDEGGSGTYNTVMEGFLIKGTATATYGVYLANTHHTIFRNINVVDVTTNALRINYSVCGLFEKFTCTINTGLAAFMPVNGIVVTAEGSYASTFATEQIFIDPIIEAVSGTGIIFDRCVFSKVINGTSEANNIGVEMTGAGGSGLNCLDGIDCESNATNDFIINGVDNILKGVISGSNLANAMVISGSRCSVDGGHALNLIITGNDNEIINFATVGGTFTDNGQRTVIHSLMDQNTNVYYPKTTNDVNLLSNGGVQAWSSGTSSAPDGWFIDGSGATIARESSIVNNGTYSAKLTRVGTDCSINSNASYAYAGINSFKGKQVCFSAWVYATTANTTRLGMNCVTSSVFSQYHPGDSSWHLLTCTLFIPTTATGLVASMVVETTNTSSYIDGASLNYGPIPLPFVETPIMPAHATGGTGSAGAGKQYVSAVIDGVTYKLLHDN